MVGGKPSTTVEISRFFMTRRIHKVVQTSTTVEISRFFMTNGQRREE